MATIDTACDTCHLDIDTVFNPGTGTRASVAITGDVLTEGPCFVADEIRFVNHGRLIFKPRGGERNEGDYFQDYFVICRRLVIVGGHQAGTLNPCGPDDPGTEYEGNNVITWAHRLSAAASGPTPNPFTAAAVADFNRNVWDSSSPNGNHGANGHAGNTGNTGGVGGPGRAAPNFTLIALEVEIDGLASHLTIDWDGQNGGKGGRGQNGSNGGNGMGGRGGVSDTSWPGTGCDRQPGNGGSGGPGGGGGTGGSGGPGGKAGDITMLSVPANLTGVLVGGNISYVNDGGSGGDGGLGGFGGRGGFGGNRGTPTTSECEAASDGANGTEGWPPPSLAQGSTANQGSSGAHGAPGSPVKFDALVEGASCADLLPLRVSIDAPGLVPSHFCRGFSTLALGEGSLTGQFLAQVTGASTSLTGVTATKKASSTDTQLDLAFTIQAFIISHGLFLMPDYMKSFA